MRKHFALAAGRNYDTCCTYDTNLKRNCHRTSKPALGTESAKDRPVDIDVGFPAMPAPVPPLSLVNAGTPTPNKGEELTPHRRGG